MTAEDEVSDDRWFGWSFLPADRRLQYDDGRQIVKAARCR